MNQIICKMPSNLSLMITVALGMQLSAFFPNNRLSSGPSLIAQLVNNPPANAGDPTLIPG